MLNYHSRNVLDKEKEPKAPFISWNKNKSIKGVNSYNQRTVNS